MVMAPTPVRPRSRRMRPTMPVGAPMPMKPAMLRVPEEVIGVGRDSGRPYFKIGDSPHGPEHIQVTPPGQPGASPVEDIPGVVEYATGGEMLVGPDLSKGFYDPSSGVYSGVNGMTSNVGTGLTGTWSAGAPQGVGVMAPSANPTQAGYDARMTTLGNTGALLNANQNVNTQQGAYLTAQQGVNTATGAYIGAQGNALNAQGGVINAERAALGPQQSLIGANAGVLAAQEGKVAADRGLVGEQRTGLNLARANEAQMYAAENNVADKTAVAQAKNTRANEDYKYGFAGMAVPTDVDVPDGTKLPPGVRASLRTQAEILAPEMAHAEKQQGFNEEAARLVSAEAGLNVSAADIAAGKVRLTVDQAQLAVKAAGLTAQEADLAARRVGLTVDQARLVASNAGIEVDRARLGASDANIQVQRSELAEKYAETPTAAGLVRYTNPSTGMESWVTPLEKQTKDAADTRNFNLQQPGTTLYTNPDGTKEYLTPDQIKQRQNALTSPTPDNVSRLSTSELLNSMASPGEYGLTREQVVDELMNRGYSRQLAIQVTEQEFESRISAKERKEAELKPIRDQITAQLYPGRTYESLTPGEKERVEARMPD